MKDIMIDEESLVELAKDLVRIDSTNPSLVEGGAGEAEIATYLEKKLKEIGLNVETQEVAPGRRNVIGIIQGTGDGRTLMLNGHTDTVSTEGMEIDPFIPVCEKGRLYGRGSIDMKAALAAMIMAAKAIRDTNIELQGDLILAFVVDEEHKSIGTEALVETYTADAAIVCEPTDLTIGVAHKGFAWINVETFGKAAHGSRPNEGVDAIMKAGKFLTEIEKMDQQLQNEKNHPLLGPASIHASLIEGGIGLSSYPDHCKIVLERRILPGETHETIINDMKNIIKKISSGDENFNADFDVFFHRTPLETSKKEQIIKSLKGVYAHTFHKDPRFTGMSFWTDAGLLDDAGIPAVLFGSRGKGLHAAVEYVEIDSVVTLAEILAKTTIDFCSG